MPPGCAAEITELTKPAEDQPPLRFTVAAAAASEGAPPLIDYACDYVVLATGGEQAPISDDRLLSDGSIVMRRQRLGAQVAAVMDNATSALVVGGGLTGVELAAELAEKMGAGAVTLAVGPTLPSRGRYPGDPGAGVLPGLRDTDPSTRSLPWWRVGGGGAVRYATKWLEARGVDVCEEWAVPPPMGATLANVTAAARPPCARTWRRAGRGLEAVGWERAGPASDLRADVVFDCRGVRPNTRQSYAKKGLLGLPAGVEGRAGWLRVDERFRLVTRTYDAAAMADPATAEPPATSSSLVYAGRCFCIGDAAEKDRMERTAANAHAEGEYVALEIRRAVAQKPPQPAYVSPPRLCAISLGRRDGIVVLGRWVALRGLLAAACKLFVQWYFVHFLPLPYWLLRRLPFKERRRYGGTGGLPRDLQLARSGAAGVLRQAQPPPLAIAQSTAELAEAQTVTSRVSVGVGLPSGLITQTEAEVEAEAQVQVEAGAEAGGEAEAGAEALDVDVLDVAAVADAVAEVEMEVEMEAEEEAEAEAEASQLEQLRERVEAAENALLEATGVLGNRLGRGDEEAN